jgi:hypothetical protein
MTKHKPEKDMMNYIFRPSLVDRILTPLSSELQIRLIRDIREELAKNYGDELNRQLRKQNI